MTKKPLVYPLVDFAHDEIDVDEHHDFDVCEPGESLLYEAIEEAFEELAAEGRIVDSGMREWNPRTGRYEIVWTAPPGKKN
jgi:hypothetical protein